jgi:hypothetical protein
MYSQRRDRVQRHITWKKSVRGGYLAFGVLPCAPWCIPRCGCWVSGRWNLVASGKLAARDKLIVADFANHTADSTLSQSVTEAFRIDIAQSPVVNVGDLYRQRRWAEWSTIPTGRSTRDRARGGGA